MEIQTFANQGHNVGCRLGRFDLVLDVDQRHGGLESLERFQEDFPVTTETYPATLTGGGGYHFFMRLSTAQADRWGTKFRETLHGFPGLEFKGLGRQVVIPGSIHPETQDLYEFDDFSNLAPKDIPAPPDDLLSKLIITVDVTDPTDSGIAPWSPEQLKSVLAKLPVEEYGTNAEWFPIMAASYHATGGAGIDEFVWWSTKDPKYKHAAPAIKARWESLQTATPTRRTAGTLLHELAKRGLPMPGDLSAADEFGAVPIPDSKERPTLSDVRAEIDVLNPNSSNSEIKPILDGMCLLEPIDRYDALDALSRQIQRPKTVLNETIKMIIQARAPIETRMPDRGEDAGDAITANALDLVFKKSQNILNLHGEFWTYTGTHWAPADSNVIGREMLYVVRDWLKAHPQSKRSVASLTNEAMQILAREVATHEDLLRLTVEPLSVINTLNGEIWIDDRTGLHECKPHDPGSYLTTCLDTEYDPEMICPLFDITLDDIFEPLEDKDEVIAHVWEMIGYTIQPRKNMPMWWLFHGGGANGKSTLIKVIEALLGQAALNCPISTFSGANSHATYDLVGKLALIDEDVEAGTRLPGGMIKKITENKRMLANPKMQKAFPFIAATSVIMAANNYPKTKDLSAGLRRRAAVIPFKKEFSEREQDATRATDIIRSELPGVLNKALAALERLRDRGNFERSPSIRKATRGWLAEANPIAAFLQEVMEPRPSTSISIIKMWNEYKFWCQDQGINHMQKMKFIDAIRSLGYGTIPGTTKRQPRFKGLRMRPIEVREDLL
jgi:P4 family phage/plasmid primase-like protien